MTLAPNPDKACPSAPSEPTRAENGHLATAFGNPSATSAEGLLATPPVVCRAHSSSLGRRAAGRLDGQSGQEEEKMGHSEFEPASRERRPWHAGRRESVHSSRSKF